LLCSHPQAAKWNSAIALGEKTMSEIATEVGLNKSSVSRHFNHHLSPALVAAGASPALRWNVERKSRQLAERMEALLNSLIGENGNLVAREDLRETWQAIRALSAETREWVKLHGQSTGELRENNQDTRMQIQIVTPWSPADAMPQIKYVKEDGEIDAEGLFAAIAVRPEW
jgi:hypothetical protein